MPKMVGENQLWNLAGWTNRSSLVRIEHGKSKPNFKHPIKTFFMDVNFIFKGLSSYGSNPTIINFIEHDRLNIKLTWFKSKSWSKSFPRLLAFAKRKWYIIHGRVSTLWTFTEQNIFIEIIIFSDDNT